MLGALDSGKCKNFFIKMMKATDLGPWENQFECYSGKNIKQNQNMVQLNVNGTLALVCKFPSNYLNFKCFLHLLPNSLLLSPSLFSNLIFLKHLSSHLSVIIKAHSPLKVTLVYLLMV